MNRAAWAVVVVGLVVPAGAQNAGVGPNYEEGDDPDHGVARLSLLSGEVTIQRGDSGEVVAGELNAPLVELDHVLTGPGSRAEIQFDWANMIRLGPVSEVRIGELRDGSYLIQVAEGTTTFRVLRDTKSYVEISTPTVSVRPVEKGIYRITVRPDGATEITVRSGQAEIFTPDGSEILRSGKTMMARGTPSNPEYMISNAIPKDDWDRWNEDRDRDLERSQSYQYTSNSIYGVDDLDPYGRWVYDPPYGNVWVPNVTPGWAPYRVGRWSWVNYYGWTWISGDPWGWAPYHYGSWYSSPHGWAWYPGAARTRYYWRPALVSFFGWGSGSITIGGSWNYSNIGWVPLAPYEIYRPWYGRGYNNVNIVNVNVVNVYRNARQLNGRDGITGVPAPTFGRGRVNTNNLVRVTNTDLARAGSVQGRVPLESTRESRRFSDRTPAPEVTARTQRTQDRQFATQTAAAKVTQDRSRREAAVMPTAPVDRNGPDRGGTPSVAGRGALTAPATEPATGFRRFEATPVPDRDATTGDARATQNTRTPDAGVRGAQTPAPVTTNDRGRREAAPQATQPAPSRRAPEPTYEPPPPQRYEAPAPTPQPRYEPPPPAPAPQPRYEPPPPPPAPRPEVRSEPAPAPAPVRAPDPPPSNEGGGRRETVESGADPSGGGRRR